jgi:hypothetical protein
MRVQDNFLLETAMAWDLERPSEFPHLSNNHSDARDVAVAVAVACAACGTTHVKGSSQVDHRS